jgi:hypothetical protein
LGGTGIPVWVKGSLRKLQRRRHVHGILLTTQGPKEFLKNFRGKLQTDGYSAYESLAKERDDLTLIGCWAHARRGFHEALTESKLAAWFVRQIGLLYAVEKELREKKSGPQFRAAMRSWQSRPILTRLRRAMELVRGRTLPQGLLGQAIDYALKRWEALTRFVDDGTLEIDNNLIYAARGINQVMPPPDLCRVTKLEAQITATSNAIGYEHAA